jgi:hypothetical protein
MQQNIDQMIAHGLQPPEMILCPEGGVHDGVILGYRPKLKPDTAQAGRCFQGFVIRNMGIVIPYVAPLQSRQVEQKGHQNYERHAQKRPLCAEQFIPLLSSYLDYEYAFSHSIILFIGSD